MQGEIEGWRVDLVDSSYVLSTTLFWSKQVGNSAMTSTVKRGQGTQLVCQIRAAECLIALQESWSFGLVALHPVLVFARTMAEQTLL